MTITQTLGRSSPSAPFDVRRVKKLLNRLGYYLPYAKTGITQFTDDTLFDAIKKFQTDQSLPATGIIKPDDETLAALNAANETAPDGAYIWRIVEDGKARAEHAKLNGTVRSFADAPDPGDDFNCRCWAEPVPRTTANIYDPPIEPVYPELVFLPFYRLGRKAIAIATQVLRSVKSTRRSIKNEKITEHGKFRLDQRKISQLEISEAIRSAKETGRIVTKTGKYGTPQNVYTGSNGITVIEETTRRNAGKIITSWHH